MVGLCSYTDTDSWFLGCYTDGNKRGVYNNVDEDEDEKRSYDNIIAIRATKSVIVETVTMMIRKITVIMMMILWM